MAKKKEQPKEELIEEELEAEAQAEAEAELEDPELAEEGSSEEEDDELAFVSIESLIEDLSAASRRKRQDASHLLALLAKRDPEQLRPYVGELIDALYRPEAQTRWEVLDALSALCPLKDLDVSEAFDGAETSLFDEGSAMVRLAAFLFLCNYGATGAKRSDAAWPLLDEAIQCYHGDTEYHDMLVGLLELARGRASVKTKAALLERVSFDAENGSGYIKSLSEQIVVACTPDKSK